MAVGEELPAATQGDLTRLRDKGLIPSVALPTVDVSNILQVVYVAEYENGAEITLLFKDEDRPNPFLAVLYDMLRYPLYGRTSDVETVIIIGETVHFPGTYAAKQTWNTRNPHHEDATVPMSKFDRNEANDWILYTNTWNHLFSESPNNPGQTLLFCTPTLDEETSKTTKDYRLRRGSREEVDGMFQGLMTTVSEVMTDERAKALGKRLW